MGNPLHFNICCENGKAQNVPEVEPPPPALLDLLTHQTKTEKRFRERIKDYNTAFSMVSFGSGVFPLVHGGHGPPIVQCHGIAYHYAGRLFPDDPNNAQYAQHYLYDPDVSLARRQEQHKDLDLKVLASLQDMMDDVSGYVKAYRKMRDVLQENNAPEIKLGFAASVDVDKSVSVDKRRYNHQQTREPAVVFGGKDGVPPTNRDIVIWPKEEKVFRVSELNEHVDPLSYPLLFPWGDLGWTPQLRHHEDKRTKTYQRLTSMQFYSHRLMIRNPKCLLPHAGGLLFQQYVCDMYSKAEAQRLAWVRMNQQTLRADDYTGLYDAVHGTPEHPLRLGKKDVSKVGSEGKDVPKVGSALILPSSYPGSPRAMHQNYCDAMSIVRKYGKPDFFITMTANPSWPEITAQLRPGESSSGRPDLVARVFHMKFRALMDDLIENQVLGSVAAYTWVIEFQKRGLPHAHLLLIMRSESKPRSPDDINRIICAELPDPNDPNQASLLTTIRTSNVHGPCGARNPLAPCMSGNTCGKNYPKEFCPETIVNENGYPTYRRRMDSPSIQKGTGIRRTAVDARDIVPYNPYLSKKYQCHLNVEFCGTIKAVKYLYKYTYKGHDRCALEFQYDEVKRYEDARYVGPPEGVWRIFGFHMHDKSHVIERLAVHLPLRQRITFSAGEERKALEKASKTGTT